MGTFSDSESPSDEVAGALSPRDRRQGQEMSPSAITTMDVPSPLPRIDAGGGGAGGVGVHMLGGASSLPGAGGSPGVESTREYSESDDDDLDTPGGGVLMGERLIP